MVKPLKTILVPAGALLVLLIIIVGAPAIWHFGAANVLLVVSFLIVAVVVAHLLGGPIADERVTLAAMLVARFPLPALVLAQANGKVQAILPVILVYLAVGVAIVPLYARLTRAKPDSGQAIALEAK
jgi:BASS family bile acid:Na+ symporter